MKALRLLPLCGLLLLAHPACARPAADRDILFQVSTIDALMSGLFDGVLSVKELKRHGDFGVGTFDALDGEMVMLEGRAWQVASDGVARRVEDARLTPFAAVTFFDRDQTAKIEQELDLKALSAYLDSLLTTKNVFCAIRLDATFAYVKTRSVPRQTKPYPTLAQVAAHQPTFEFSDVRGTIVALRCPYFVAGANVPGYHFHFIDEQRTRGGHLLECRLTNGTVSLDLTPDFTLRLPQTPEFYRQPLGPDSGQGLEKVEKGSR